MPLALRGERSTSPCVNYAVRSAGQVNFTPSGPVADSFGVRSDRTLPFDGDI